MFTGKSLSEALILASTNPKYDKGLFIELQVQYMKITAQNMLLTQIVLNVKMKNNLCTQHTMSWGAENIHLGSQVSGLCF